jgi:signal peptidase I
VSLPADIAGLPRAGQNVTFVKRVVGLPGDRLEVKEGVVSVNGQVLPQEPLGEVAGRPGRREKALLLRERAPNGVTYEIMRYQGSGDGGAYVVPQGHYFLMGDNRDDSLDSRFWAQRGGWYLPAGNVAGQTTYIYWSGLDHLDRIGRALK